MKHFNKILTVSLIVVSGLALFLLSCEETPTQAQDPYLLWQQQANENEKIVFVSTEDSELYLLEKSGVITRLTTNTRLEDSPALSPDGQKVAFTRAVSGDSLSEEIWVIDVNTKRETQLDSNGVRDANPDWSPDGSKIVFASFRDAQGNPSSAANIYVVNSDGTGQPTQLTNSPSLEDNDPAWSPDGSKIVFTRTPPGNAQEELYIMDSNGANVQQLTKISGSQSDHSPSWSPNGTTIVFSRYEGSKPWTVTIDLLTNLETDYTKWQEVLPWNIYTVSPNGGDPTKLTEYTDTVSLLPVFSADGSKVLFLRFDLTVANNQVRRADRRWILMDSDGTGQEQLIPDYSQPSGIGHFDW